MLFFLCRPFALLSPIIPPAPYVTPPWLEIVKSVAPAVSAVAAFFSVLTARSAIRTQAAARQTERRAGLYGRLVLEPAIKALTDFERDAAELIRRQCVSIPVTVRDKTMDDARQLVEVWVAEYKKLFDPVYTLLVSSARAWKVESFRDTLVRAAEQVEDVSARFSSLLVGNESEASLVELVRASVAEALATVVHYDPGEEARKAVKRKMWPFDRNRTSSV